MLGCVSVTSAEMFSLQELTVTRHKPLHEDLFAKLHTGDADLLCLVYLVCTEVAHFHRSTPCRHHPYLLPGLGQTCLLPRSECRRAWILQGVVSEVDCRGLRNYAVMSCANRCCRSMLAPLKVGDPSAAIWQSFSTARSCRRLPPYGSS